MADQTSSWSDFLPTLDAGLAKLAARVQQVASDPDHSADPVRGQSTAKRAARNEALIGVGQLVETEHEGICLNNKDAHFITGQDTRYASVTDLVLSQHPVLWDTWRARVGVDTTPERFFNRFTLVVEDASPDSCFALVVFLARLAGVDAKAIPSPWVDYIRHWEQGDVITTGAPFQSYGALHNALAHSYFSDAWGQAWVDCLGLLVGALRADIVPSQLTSDVPWPQLQKARACLAFEQQVYEDSLAHATCVQLALPLSGASGRYKLVDAYLAEEPVPLGSLKVFLRTDTVHAHLKQGFTLMALYKSDPAEAGSGNDLSVSVTPQAGVHLEDLWWELERLEFDEWGDARPNDHPRIGILGYPQGQRPDGEPAPNQPWYDGGDYTLLAAPKRLANEELGSKLGWRDVRDAIWRVYNPFQRLHVLDSAGTPVSLEACRPDSTESRATDAATKDLILAQWPQALKTASESAPSPEKSPFLRFTPTFKSYLAASLKRNAARAGQVMLDDLPAADHYDFVELTGGFAVIAEQGAYVIDDWHSEPLPQADIRREFASADKLFQVIQASASDVSTLTQDIKTYLLHGDAPGQDEGMLLNRLTELRIRLSQTQADTLSQSFDPSVRRFRQTLEARWGVAGRLEAFHRAADQVDTILNNHLAQRQAEKTKQLSEELNENIRLVTEIQKNGRNIATELSGNVSTVTQIQRKIEWLEVFFVSFYATELAHLISAAFFTPVYGHWSVLVWPILAGGIAAIGLRPWAEDHGESSQYRWAWMLGFILLLAVVWFVVGYVLFPSTPVDPSTVGLPASGAGGH